MGSLLVLMIFLPLAGAVAVALVGSARAELVRLLTLAVAVVTLFLTLAVVAGYRSRDDAANETQLTAAEKGPIQPRMIVRKSWLEFAVTGRDQAQTPSKLEFFIGMDGISLWLVVLTALLVVSSVLVSWEAIQERVAEFYALLLILETGLLGVFCAFDLILFYIFFEFTLIPLFFIIGIWGGPKRDYAARKFFIYTLTGSLISLIGLVGLVLTVYARTGNVLTFSIPALAATIQHQTRLIAGTPAALDWYNAQWWLFLALFAGFAIKVPLFPFHTWLPLAHVEAPTAGSVLLAGVLLKLGSYGFLRLCLPLLPYGTWNLGAPLLATLAVIGVLYGALCALAQDDIKRLVAYSSVSHLGFCMLGMAALNSEGITGSVLQMVNHGLSTGALFLLVGMLYERYHTRMLGELGGIASRLPLLAVFMVFISLSSLGLPGLNGFIGEVLTLIGMFKLWPAYTVIAALGIILGAWYLLAMVQRAFFGSTEHLHGDSPAILDLKPRELAALVPIALLCLWIGLYPKPFLMILRADVDAVAQIYQDHTKLKPPAVPPARVAEARP